MVTLNTMKHYLSKSLSSFNDNKSRGLLAEHKLIEELNRLGFANRIAPGGWIVRNTGNGEFAHHTAVLFPKIITPEYINPTEPENPPRGLHTICATMHQIGIRSYFCTPIVSYEKSELKIDWSLMQLGIPYESIPLSINTAFPSFIRRRRRYNFLRYNCDVSNFPNECIYTEFSKENLRICFQEMYFSEMSDIDGVFWGENVTYPIEIKEKVPGVNAKMGEFFGIDAGPFVKLAFYASKRQNMHSLFFVREVTQERLFVKWWFIRFETMAQYASWIPIGGGRSMIGGQSHVVIIPKYEFSEMTRETLSQL